MVEFIIKLINLIIKGLGTVLSWVFSLLPSSPFQIIDNSPVLEYLGNLAWIIPFPQILSILELWVSSIALYYAVSVVLRWLKAIK